MKATKLFKQYRLQVFSNLMTKKEYRDLQAEKDVNVKKEAIAKYPQLFYEEKSKAKGVK